MTVSSSRTPPAVLERIVGQDAARNLLAGSLRAAVHAYLFHGPPGTGKRAAATAFAAALLCDSGGCGVCSTCRAVLAGQHPDVVIVERTGAAISVESAREIGALAQRTPRLASRQVIVLVDFHLVDRAAPALLKTLEEPPATTVFIVLAETIPPALVTIASRCLRVEFQPLEISAIERALGNEGVDAEIAAGAAAAAEGRLDRARLLAHDPHFVERSAWWRSLPSRLDGTGATVAVLIAELLESLGELVSVLREQQSNELEEITAAAERAGERRVPGLHLVEERHRREQRRVRTDELRAGLATLAMITGERLATSGAPATRVTAQISASAAIDAAAAALVRNPNEELLLSALLLTLDALG